MAIFNSYVKLPEGNVGKTKAIFTTHDWKWFMPIYKKCDDWGMVYDIAWPCFH